MPAPTPEPRSPAARGWLVGPWFDALLIANVAWPLVLLAQFGDGFGGREGVQFWQLYFVTAPHRWITLLLVFADRERFAERRGLFLALFAAAVVVVLSVRLTTGTLVCLMTVDYLWNAWHFASQHHGIYRIYGRLGGPQPTSGLAFEKWAMRGFLLYVTLRVATATWPDTELEGRFRALDWLALLVPAWLLVRDFSKARDMPRGRLVYLGSMCLLYVSLLWAVHERRPWLILALATASALFHATEYLALVSWSVRQRHAVLGDRMGALGFVASRWGAALGVFALALGVGGWLIDQGYAEEWLLLNVVAAYLHYAYDGLIWRRRPAS